MMYRLKGEPWLLAEALKRGDELASLNPAGPTSFASQDQATRQISLTLVKAVDMLAAGLDAGRKAR